MCVQTRFGSWAHLSASSSRRITQPVLGNLIVKILTLELGNSVASNLISLNIAPMASFWQSQKSIISLPDATKKAAV